MLNRNLSKENLKLFACNSEFMQDFFTRVMGIVNQIRFYRGYLRDQSIVEFFSRSLPTKFDGYWRNENLTL